MSRLFAGTKPPVNLIYIEGHLSILPTTSRLRRIDSRAREFKFTRVTQRGIIRPPVLIRGSSQVEADLANAIAVRGGRRCKLATPALESAWFQLESVRFQTFNLMKNNLLFQLEPWFCLSAWFQLESVRFQNFNLMKNNSLFQIEPWFCLSLRLLDPTLRRSPGSRRRATR